MMNTQEQRVRAAAYKLGVPADILEGVFLRENSSVLIDESMTAEEIAATMTRVCRRGGMALSAPTHIVEHREHVEQDAGEQFDEALGAPHSPDELPDEFAEAVGLPRTPDELPDEVCEALGTQRRHNAGEAFLHAITERY